MPEKKDKILIKQYDAETKEVENSNSLLVTITTNEMDRAGDIVVPKGVSLKNYKKNPVVLMSHDYSGLPIGTADNFVISDDKITARVNFPEEGTYPLADTVKSLYKQKIMRAWSIGFMPTKSEDIVDEETGKKVGYGQRFVKSELLEFSACAVPCNPGALTNMMAKGINVDLLKEEGLIIIEDEPKEKVIVEGINEKGEKVKEEIEITPFSEGETFEKGGVKTTIEETFSEEIKSEPEEKQEDQGFSIDKIYEIVKENKELKAKIAELEVKAGAVLNAKNKSNLKNAQNLIQAVLDSAGTEEESINDDNIVEKETEEDDLIIIDNNTEKDTERKSEPVEKEENETLQEYIKTAVNKALNYHLGKVSK